MVKKNKPLLTDAFLNELAKEINEIYGWRTDRQIKKPTIDENDKIVDTK